MTPLSDLLHRLFVRGRLREEEAFLGALLGATLYCHVPLGPAPRGRIRFVQFVRPDNGKTVLPLFTDEAKASFAAGGDVQILAMPGREVLMLTQGATLMLNPNDEGYVLYPEEVSALRAGRPLGGLSTERFGEQQARIGPPSVPVEALVKVLAPLHAADPMVHASFVMEMHEGPSWNDRSLLLIIVTEPAEAERLVRASAVAAQPALGFLTLPLAIKDWGPNEPLPPLWNQSAVIQAPRRPEDSSMGLH
jgi:SseB protein N-terminal domain